MYDAARMIAKIADCPGNNKDYSNEIQEISHNFLLIVDIIIELLAYCKYKTVPEYFTFI